MYFGCILLILFTLSTLFAEPRVGEAQAKRLEDDLRICRKCRHIYFLLATATAAEYAVFSPLVADPTDSQDAAVMLPLSRWSSHIPTAQRSS